MIYQGSCHCGRVAYTVEGEIGSVTECNCSICRRRGHLLWFVPRDQLKLTTPESDLATYTFRTHAIQHRFCPVCGCGTYGEAKGPDGKPMAAINVRCLDGVELASLTVKQFDGRSL